MVSAATKVLLLLTTSGRFSNSSEDVPFGTGWWWAYAGISTVLVIFAGIMSGLTLGLMSLGLVDLEVLQRSGTDTEKKQAAKIFPVVQKQHQLLVTLLLCNAVAMEALPIFLDKIFNPVAAVILSVTFVLAFGEVIPQAICSRYGLAVGANLVWLVRILMCICYPVAFPVGKILDALLGHNESALFRRAQLKALVSIHSKEAGKGGELTHDETTIISGALDLTTKTAEEAMTPIESTFSLDVTSRLDWEAMGKILARGHSRVPVYAGNPRNIIGLLLVKNLLTVRPEAETPVSAVSIRRIPRVPADMPLYDILNEFQKGNSHMAAVVRTKFKRQRQQHHQQQHDEQDSMAPKTQNGDAGRTGQGVDFSNENQVPQSDLEKGIQYDKLASQTDLTGVKNRNVKTQKDERPSDDQVISGLVTEDIDDGEIIGIITLEDVIEELLQEEIVDETDEYVDVHKRIRVVTGPASKVSSSVRRVGSHRMMANSGRQGTQLSNSSRSINEDVRSNDNSSKPRHSLTEPLIGSGT